jgi:hypothetical protein
MNLGLRVFLEVVLHIAVLAYISGKNSRLQEISQAVEALVQLFLATGFVTVLLKGSAKETCIYLVSVFLLLNFARAVVEL